MHLLSHSSQESALSIYQTLPSRPHTCAQWKGLGTRLISVLLVVLWAIGIFTHIRTSGCTRGENAFFKNYIPPTHKSLTICIFPPPLLLARHHVCSYCVWPGDSCDPYILLLSLYSVFSSAILYEVRINPYAWRHCNPCTPSVEWHLLI